MFNEITKNAIEKAFEKPGQVNINLVDAQQARRVLDRLVGYKISPLLWDKVRRGLSAGRVQTVALRLIVEREREIRAFEAREYWTIDADLGAKKPPLLVGPADQAGRPAGGDRHPRGRRTPCWRTSTARSTSSSPSGTREKKRNPVAPFITSTLQQEASRKLRFSVKRTMMLAQRLYEGVEVGKEGSVGLITYMRTDSTRVAAGRPGRRARFHRRALRQAVPAGIAQHLQEQEGRAGRARSHPAHLHGARAGSGGEFLAGRRAEAVPADLEPLCRLADDAGALRPDHHRRGGQGQRRRGVPVPRHRLRAEVRRLPQGLRGRQGPDGRGRRGAEAPPAGWSPKASACSSGPSSPSSISPSRRRATTKPRW